LSFPLRRAVGSSPDAPTSPPMRRPLVALAQASESRPRVPSAVLVERSRRGLCVARSSRCTPFAVFDTRAAAPLWSDLASSHALCPLREFNVLPLFVFEPTRRRVSTPLATLRRASIRAPCPLRAPLSSPSIESPAAALRGMQRHALRSTSSSRDHRLERWIPRASPKRRTRNRRLRPETSVDSSADFELTSQLRRALPQTRLTSSLRRDFP